MPDDGRHVAFGKAPDAARSEGRNPALDGGAPKPLLLAAIGAVASIRPAEARRILVDLADSGDEEIAEAADEAIALAEAVSVEGDDEEVGSEWIN